MDFSARTGYNF